MWSFTSHSENRQNVYTNQEMKNFQDFTSNFSKNSLILMMLLTLYSSPSPKNSTTSCMFSAWRVNNFSKTTKNNISNYSSFTAHCEVLNIIQKYSPLYQSHAEYFHKFFKPMNKKHCVPQTQDELSQGNPLCQTHLVGGLCFYFGT